MEIANKPAASLVADSSGLSLSQPIQSKAGLFGRITRAPGAAFEYATFVNKEEQRCVCVFQVGPLLEGQPG